MVEFDEMGFYELQEWLGMAAFKLWKRLPQPKEDYTSWYYGTREQCLRDVLEGHNVEGTHDPD